MKTLKKLKLIFPILFVAFLFSCNDSESNSINKDAPTISVRLVDAPGDYEAVNVEVVDVMIKIDDDSDGDNGWMSLEATNETVNLLDFTGGFSKVLVNRFPIPTGTLSQMRLVLGDGNTIVIKNDSDVDETFDLKTPSAQQSGLKIKIDAVIEEGFTYDYILDFDVEKSIVHAGNSGNIILKPVLYASAEVNSGVIEGLVVPAEALPAVASVLVDDNGTPENSEDDFIISANTDENGAFALWGIPAGTYKVMVTPADEVSDYGSASTMDVVVVNGEITTIAEPIVMMLKPGTIAGTVSGVTANVKINIAIDDEEATSVDADAEGKGEYLIEDVAPGNYKVTISAEGYVAQEFDIILDPDEDEVVNATLVVVTP